MCVTRIDHGRVSIVVISLGLPVDFRKKNSVITEKMFLQGKSKSSLIEMFCIYYRSQDVTGFVVQLGEETDFNYDISRTVIDAKHLYQ